ncbi:cell envelope integrity protein TolA [Herbaspirillum sp. GCM10030257]|uniref:cell envelope integrity protein TolA n=1 Tax=Herbaspirillum sp. GCM10030257 TaxID=3273393 RepID=UPI003609FDC3
MTDSAPYTVPQERGRWRALILAALVHLALLVFLWIGVRWQNETPTTIEAEIWSPQPREAAPVPEPVKAPEPKPEPKPEPQPVPKVAAPEPPKPKIEEPPVAKPDIALEQEKKRKIEEKKRREEEERKEEERKEKLALEKKQQDEKLALEKKRRDEELAKEKKREQEKREQEEKEKIAKAKAEEAKRLEKEKAAKAEAEKKLVEKKRQQEEADAKLAQKMREEDMRRITGAGGSGDAPKAQGGRADGAYSQRIAAKIRSNISFIVPESLQGNPPVEYEVRLLPDGSVAGLRKLRSSGVPGFDEAVARAIERSQPYPKDSSGSVPSTFIGHHKPKDQ